MDSDDMMDPHATEREDHEVSKKTKHYGYDSGGHSTSQWLSPRNPQTGDGRTRRSILDAVKVVFRDKNGNKTK